jgi:deazaflavin-dependent oxidoreductase (nitroreductase family)
VVNEQALPDIPSRPPNRSREHVQLYQSTNGEIGHIWNGNPTLLLTTVGRKSGETWTTPLIYGRDGDRYVLIASAGGSARDPQWVGNVRANPEVQVQVGAERFTARAEVANAKERQHLWQLMTAVYPSYEVYQAESARTFPVLVLQRT